MGEVITFYSYKGGVGRTMAVANTAALLATRGYRVLVVDWDLEAPGLHNYFAAAFATQRSPVGLIDLVDAAVTPSAPPLAWRDCCCPCLPDGLTLDLLPSGYGADGFEQRVLGFDWIDFYTKRGGEQFLEIMRDEWLAVYDFVLIDSRTGLTDTGGICTAFMPDTLVMVLTANQQSLDGTANIINKSQAARQKLRVSRAPLTYVPLISRWDGREEQREAEIWLARIRDGLGRYVEDWFPKGRNLDEIFAALRIPHVAFFSFGEKLPALTHNLTDTELPGFHYATLVNVLELVTNPDADLTHLLRPARWQAPFRRVYVSAPQHLHHFQAIARDVFAKHGVEIVSQDNPRAASTTTEDTLEQLIAQADALLLLVRQANDGATATLPSGQTHQEFEYHTALRYNLPVFSYLNAPTGTTAPAPANSGTQQRQAFITRVQKTQPWIHFRDGAELRTQLMQALRQQPRKLAPSRLLHHAPERLWGRDDWLASLDAAWQEGNVNVYSVVAWGGVGKSALIAYWVGRHLAAKNWPGVECYFDWSFDSQGADANRAVASDLFLEHALTFFDDPEPNQGTPWERGIRLAHLIRKQRTLLVLDDLEALQYPSDSPLAGKLQDPALEALLQMLAQANPGLCLVTSRLGLNNIGTPPQVVEVTLEQLALEDARALLRPLPIAGTADEWEHLWRITGGHPLTLQLLGRYLADAHLGSLSHVDQFHLEASDFEQHGQTVFKVLRQYEAWLQQGDIEQQRALAVLRLTGLFDRPMTRDSVRTLRMEPAIAGLTEPLMRLTPVQFERVLQQLSDATMIAVVNDTITTHPLVRTYFAQQLRDTNQAAYRQAHSRLFDHLCHSTPYRPDSFEGLQPLYHAVTHGCLAGRQQEALEKVFTDRIQRGNEFFSTNQLGAVSADLVAITNFFDEPWSRVTPNLAESEHGWLLNLAATLLRSSGRLAESLQPARINLESAVQRHHWRNAAQAAGTLSALEVTLGDLDQAMQHADAAVRYADQSGDAFQQVSKRATAADALHQYGRTTEAGELFAAAERLQQERQPQDPLLYSLWGYQYGDWLLAPAELAAWYTILHGQPRNESDLIGARRLCDTVEQRVRRTQRDTSTRGNSLDVAFNLLMLARVGLVREIITQANEPTGFIAEQIAGALKGLRAVGQLDLLPRALLTAAWYHGIRRNLLDAHQNLEEAQRLAERGPMPFSLADVFLTRARLFRDPVALDEAAAIIERYEYRRRVPELADTQAAAIQWTTLDAPAMKGQP